MKQSISEIAIFKINTQDFEGKIIQNRVNCNSIK